MRQSVQVKALTSLQSLIDDKLTVALLSGSGKNLGGLTAARVHSVSKGLARSIMADVDLLSELSKAAPKDPPDEWLTTEQAAQISGYSRPFIASLLDSGVYPGKIHKTPMGHRRVKAIEFKAWVAKSKTFKIPKTVEEVRTGAIVETEIPDVSASEAKARAQARKRSMDVAKSLLGFA